MEAQQRSQEKEKEMKCCIGRNRIIDDKKIEVGDAGLS